MERDPRWYPTWGAWSAAAAVAVAKTACLWTTAPTIALMLLLASPRGSFLADSNFHLPCRFPALPRLYKMQGCQLALAISIAGAYRKASAVQMGGRIDRQSLTCPRISANSSNCSSISSRWIHSHRAVVRRIVDRRYCELPPTQSWMPNQNNPQEATCFPQAWRLHRKSQKLTSRSSCAC